MSGIRIRAKGTSTNQQSVQQLLGGPSLQVSGTSTIITSGVLVLLSAVLLTIGFFSLRIYQSCDAFGKDRSDVNYYASIIGIGIGIGILSYLLLTLGFILSEKIPLVILSLLLIGAASANIYFYNTDRTETGQALNTGLLGAGLGLTLGFTLLLLEAVPTLLRLRIIGFLLTSAVVVFSIFGINTYQKCEKPSDAKTPLIALSVSLGIGLLLFMGIVTSFFFAP